MSITIKAAQNGYIVTELDWDNDDMPTKEYIYQSLKDALAHVTGCFDDSGRHSEKRVYVIEAPGDKHENFRDAHYEVIWGVSNEKGQE